MWGGLREPRQRRETKQHKRSAERAKLKGREKAWPRKTKTKTAETIKRSVVLYRTQFHGTVCHPGVTNLSQRWP